jgi:NADPH-dependent curcumin reductase CurA
MTLISQKATLQGFIVFDYANRYQEGREVLAQMLKDGKLRYKYTYVDGLDGCVEGLKGLFDGKNEGKMVVRVWDGKRGGSRL